MRKYSEDGAPYEQAGNNAHARDQIKARQGFYFQPRSSGRGLPEMRALWCGNSITLRVQVTSHLHSVTGFPLLYVLIHSGLQQVGILALGLPDSHYTLVCCFDKHRWVGRLHVRPHLLKHSDFGPLTARIVNKKGMEVQGEETESV